MSISRSREQVIQSKDDVLEFASKNEIAEKEQQVYEQWADLVRRIQAGEINGMEELYEMFSRGTRFYLWSQTGRQDCDDKLHDVFVLIVQAIRRGELREPERLMGFVRIIVQRQVFAHVKGAVEARRRHVDLVPGHDVAGLATDPEESAIKQQHEQIVKQVLAEMSKRDREVLRRFYIEEQGPEQICQEMDLTETQFRLLKSRAKARAAELGKKKLLGRQLAVRVQMALGCPPAAFPLHALRDRLR